MPEAKKVCRILSLDGGGAKGFYTLGVLREVEALLPKPIHETFHLIFGTSTGSIIASLLALGEPVDTIRELYETHIPAIMKQRTRATRSAALRGAGREVLRAKTFEDTLTGLGVVSTKWHLETPMIFKSRQTQAHGRRATFVPGFGCTLADAVEASCSAYPFFDRKTVTTSAGDVIELFDGGFCANNPTLYAIADATAALGFRPQDCRVLSVGCGQYPEPRRGALRRWVTKMWPLMLLQKTLEVNTASMEQLRSVLFSQVPTVRVSDAFDKPELATDLLEHDLKKLNLLRQQGAVSFASREKEIRKLLLEEVGDGGV